MNSLVSDMSLPEGGYISPVPRDARRLNTPIHEACRLGNLEIVCTCWSYVVAQAPTHVLQVEFLLERGAASLEIAVGFLTLYLKLSISVCQIPGNCFRTPLLAACAGNYAEIVQRLLEAGADPTVKAGTRRRHTLPLTSFALRHAGL